MTSFVWRRVRVYISGKSHHETSITCISSHSKDVEVADPAHWRTKAHVPQVKRNDLRNDSNWTTARVTSSSFILCLKPSV